MNSFSRSTRGRLAALAIGLVALPAVAQQTTTPSTTTGGMGTTTSVDRRDDGFDWGWLGLLGLAGLAGLKRRDHVGTMADTRRTT